MSERTFHFSDGKSDKFWKIILTGSSHTVHFGRVGTAGQAQTKEFASEAEAQKSHDKLIQEKIKKGYVEVSDSTTIVPGSQPTSKAKSPQVKETPKESLGLAVDSANLEDGIPPAIVSNPPEKGKEPVLTTAVPRELMVTRSIQLEVKDSYWDPKNRPYIPLGDPPPFDRKAATKTFIETVIKDGYYHYYHRAIPGMEKLRLPLTQEEARFWIHARESLHQDRLNLYQGNKTSNAKSLTAYLEEMESQPITLDTIRQLFCRHASDHAIMMIPLSVIFSPEELITLMRDEAAFQQVAQTSPNPYYKHYWTQMVMGLLAGFHTHVVPRLSSEQVASLSNILRPHLHPSLWPFDYQQAVNPYESSPDAAFHLAAYLGMTGEMQTLVNSWPDDLYRADPYKWSCHLPQDIVLRLGDPDAVQHHIRRLKLPLTSVDYLRGWLYYSQYQGLDIVYENVLAGSQASRDHGAELLKVLSLVEAPEIAPYMLELMLQSKLAIPAIEWLKKHPQLTIVGLLPLASGKGRSADAAVQWLRDLVWQGWGSSIAAILQTQPPEAAAKLTALLLESPTAGIPPLDEQTTPADLKEAFAQVKAKAKNGLPNWFLLTDCPPIFVGQFCLNPDQIQKLVIALQQSTLTAPHPLIPTLKKQADAVSLDQFAWKIFDRWLNRTAPSADKWSLVAVGLLGSDASALKLAPLIRVWPGESQHQRAVLGLECLRTIGSDTALMQINGIAQKVKFKGIQAKAQTCMEEIAQARGLSREQLEDRIVPDCDLDERGSRLLDFGPRQFRLVLGSDMKPLLRDSEGKLKPDLPKPNSKDDPIKANQAIADWKLLKKQVNEVAKVQAIRLEQAMITGRRWTVADFESLMVHHPLMINLVRLLVWGAYDAVGQLVTTFRVTEDQTYGNAQDDPLDLPESVTQIGILHAAHLPPEQAALWGELFSDYEIMPPFPQLGRETYQLDPALVNKTEITDFASYKIPAITLVGILERLNWMRGIPEDGGCFHSHSKPFHSANVTAVMEYDGIPVGYMMDWDPQSIDRCFFVPGIQLPKAYPQYLEKIPLGQVDAVVISEVLKDLHTLAAKAG
ncbi:MAG: DUF4132 domain-containing protein [Cyanobacteriota bacterium]|nr:DUF4132 domain-containing protein [Cyanobacteriota bacterium]